MFFKKNKISNHVINCVPGSPCLPSHYRRYTNWETIPRLSIFWKSAITHKIPKLANSQACCQKMDSRLRGQNTNSRWYQLCCMFWKKQLQSVLIVVSGLKGSFHFKTALRFFPPERMKMNQLVRNNMSQYGNLPSGNSEIKCTWN